MGVPIQIFTLKNKSAKKKKLLPKFIVSTVLILFFCINSYGLYVGNKFYKCFFEADTHKGADLYSQNKSFIDEIRYSSIHKEDVSVGSRNNYRLYGTYLVNPTPTKNTIILLHDFSGSRYSSLKYIDMYLDKGFNVLIYDSRNHGKTGGSNITFGFAEKFDLDRWITWVAAKNKGGIIGVHGEGLGAATALLQASLNETSKRVSFYIADSSYSNLEQLFKLKLQENYNIRNPFIVKFLLFYTEKVNKYNNEFTFKEASPINYIKMISTPVLFIHGENDTNIPKAMSEALFNLKPAFKSIYIAPKAGYLESYKANEKEYKEKINKFVDSLALKK
ncbi:alpha/beta hydrolase [Candidatus Clostridium radicumherbarum]|uniref:Alpha/beta hydrolase n=1 Tax=Candidatus Clostridium radicumherbarum TaxID=3381662 RepID=A0ABW8TPJ7_9CLOT